MVVKGKATYEAIQLKRGNEKEVLDFIKRNVASAWCNEDDGRVHFVCTDWSNKARYGDYIVCVAGRVNVVSKSEFNEFYEIVK